MLATVALLVSVLTANPGAPALAPGQQVKVEGRFTADGGFDAQEAVLRDADGFSKVEGLVDSVSDDRTRLRIAVVEVKVTRRTALYRGSQRSTAKGLLASGTWIEAKGVWRNGILEATRIRVKAAPEATGELEGAIESGSGRELVILGRHVTLRPNAKVVDERTGTLPAHVAQRLRRDDDDGEGRRPIEIGNVVLGGRLEGAFLGTSNFDVDAPDADRAVLSRAQILASSRVNDRIEGYTKVTFNRTMELGAGSAGQVQVSEAYLLIHDVAGAPVTLQIGRQRFRDQREWFFDDYLDAIRAQVRLPAVTFETAVSYGIASGATATRSRGDQLQFIGSARTQIAPALQMSGYAIARRDVTRHEQPIWFGAEAHGRVGADWTYWTDAALRRGSNASGRLRGWAFDGGVTRRFTGRWSPSLTVGYAGASGDAHRGDAMDTRFRQTDLEDNQSYYGGFRRIASYGELFDPELTNLHVLTAGLGFRPRRTLGLDFVYHRFVQQVASTSLPSGNVDGELNGVSTALGQELNGVFTLRLVSGVDIDVAAGVFLPGASFTTDTHAAFFWRPQIRIYF